MKISVSSLMKYWRCPELYRKVYVEKLPKEPPNPAMVKGIGAHAGIECGLKSMIDGKKPNLVAMISSADAAFFKAYAEIPEDIVDMIGSREMTEEAHRRQVERAVAVAHKSLLPRLTPIAAEKYFKTEWSPGVMIDGFIDCVQIDEKGELTIDDFKIGNSSRTPPKDSAEISVQLQVYSLIWERLTGDTPKKGRLHHYVPSKRAHFTTREVEFTPERKKAIETRIDRTVEAIKAGAFPPGDPFWVCTEARCPMYNRCSMGAGNCS